MSGVASSNPARVGYFLALSLFTSFKSCCLYKNKIICVCMYGSKCSKRKDAFILFKAMGSFLKPSNSPMVAFMTPNTTKHEYERTANQNGHSDNTFESSGMLMARHPSILKELLEKRGSKPFQELYRRRPGTTVIHNLQRKARIFPISGGTMNFRRHTIPISGDTMF